MTVRIRMKKMGRTHRPYFRIVAMDKRSPRDGRVIEELGTYDPMCPETDARVSLKSDRVDYWVSVGAQPSDKVAVLIKKYGTEGTHLDAQKEALERLSKRKEYTPALEPVKPAKKKKEEPKAEAEPAAEAAPAEEAAADAAPADETAAPEAATEEATSE
jgi:small subunit ribosomal protein S16